MRSLTHRKGGKQTVGWRDFSFFADTCCRLNLKNRYVMLTICKCLIFISKNNHKKRKFGKIIYFEFYLGPQNGQSCVWPVKRKNKFWLSKKSKNTSPHGAGPQKRFQKFVLAQFRVTFFWGTLSPCAKLKKQVKIWIWCPITVWYKMSGVVV